SPVRARPAHSSRDGCTRSAHPAPKPLPWPPRLSRSVRRRTLRSRGAPPRPRSRLTGRWTEVDRDGKRGVPPRREVAPIARLVLLEEQPARLGHLRRGCAAIEDLRPRLELLVGDTDADGGLAAEVAHPVGAVAP